MNETPEEEARRLETAKEFDILAKNPVAAWGGCFPVLVVVLVVILAIVA